jgi:hypothetical protein
MSELCAITTIFNPASYQSRFKLYHDFRDHIERSGIALYAVELATGDREFSVTSGNDPYHIQVRSECEIWHKENLINIALKRLPPRWDSVAWLDADIAFVRPDWVSVTKEKLKQHSFVQMFSHVLDLGPHLAPLGLYEGFVYRHLMKEERRHCATEDIGVKAIGHTGYAWAARRDVVEGLGGLIETSILGSNDYFMAQALVGAVTPEMTRMPGSNYATSLLEWQQRCKKLTHHDIGYVDTTILHFWHGRRVDRGYDTRWRILVENQFDPLVDLKKNADGLLELTTRSATLREAIRSYFRSRNEDSLGLI